MTHDFGYRGLQLDVSLTAEHIELLHDRYHALVPKRGMHSTSNPSEAFLDPKKHQELLVYLGQFESIGHALLMSGYTGGIALLNDAGALKGHLSSPPKQGSRTLTEVVSSFENNMGLVLASSKRQGKY